MDSLIAWRERGDEGGEWQARVRGFGKVCL